MKKYIVNHFFLIPLLMLLTTVSNAQSTQRIPQFSNDRVVVWKTIIYPNAEQTLSMHRHDHDRVLVALTDGVLKITNDKGHIHYLKIKKDQAYYLRKDAPNELHQDQNLSQHPIKVIVIELQ